MTLFCHPIIALPCRDLEHGRFHPTILPPNPHTQIRAVIRPLRVDESVAAIEREGVDD
ncbi:MAG: hypothetical protein H6662_18215 [Ardenticatenaceae bacterium]|nr:hypothetical protein [Anaerolineales bacterium]MCB8923526.1 hypothetical protein [Ardenticatenaceae bacterium]MCB8991903.1 hypothetical protein [Ardenticatenaceae bacterium]MCB9003749.1 hypothetical protein [Ardenticatenaceae bacterium]